VNGRRARDGQGGDPDAVVVGSGPNGLAAALTLARAGLAVEVHEGAQTAGGGCRTAELTLPGYAHDVCSTVHPLLAASPFFRRARLRGLKLLTPELAFAHPLEGGRAVTVGASVAGTAASLGADGRVYRRLLGPLVAECDAIVESALSPLTALPRHPLAMTRFGLRGVWPVTTLGRLFASEEARALLAGLGAHSMQPLSAPGTGAFGLMLGMLAHSVGWPIVEGGSQRIAEELIAEIEAAGGAVHTGRWVSSLE
jgi:phytoene dehydrogenase-like protein